MIQMLMYSGPIAQTLGLTQALNYPGLIYEPVGKLSTP